MKPIKVTQTKSVNGERKRTIAVQESWCGTWTDHRSLIACFLAQSKFDVPEDVFGLIDEECFVTIYDLKHRLLFASMEFLNTVSFPLEVLTERPWQELYEVDRRLIEIANDLVKGEMLDVVDLSEIPVHMAKEINSERLVKVHYAPNFLAPIFDSAGKVAGYITGGYLSRAD